MRYPYPMPYDADDDQELFDDTFSVASTMECTGLIPAAPASSADVDSYSEIYDIPLSKNPEKANHHLQSVKKQKKERG